MRTVGEKLVEWTLAVILAVILAIRDVDTLDRSFQNPPPVVFPLREQPDYQVLLAYPRRYTLMFYGMN